MTAGLFEKTSATLLGFVQDDSRDFLVDTAANMRAWLDAVKTIG